MKNNFFLRFTSIMVMLVSFLFASGNSATANTAKHPPGIKTECMHASHYDLQGSTDFNGGLIMVAILPGESCEPRINLLGAINLRAGKALPKTARQRLFGMPELLQGNQKLC